MGAHNRMKYKPSVYEKFIKRLFDIILCSIALIILLPLYIFVAVGIKTCSPGPVFYRSDRAGKNKKAFRFFKFRSMHVTNNDKHMYVADSERLFPFGRLIRRLKLDELPQLINVIIGDMSIVGPRPMPLKTAEWFYSGEYEPVSWIRPGLTSAASLFDYTVGDTYTDNDAYIREIVPIKRELELMYFEKQGFIYDASLVWRTVVTIVSVFLGEKRFSEQPELAEAKQRVLRRRESDERQ